MSVIVKVPFLTNNYDITKNEKLTKDIDVLSDEYRYENIKPGTKIYRVSYSISIFMVHVILKL